MKIDYLETKNATNGRGYVGTMTGVGEAFMDFGYFDEYEIVGDNQLKIKKDGVTRLQFTYNAEPGSTVVYDDEGNTVFQSSRYHLAYIACDTDAIIVGFFVSYQSSEYEYSITFSVWKENDNILWLHDMNGSTLGEKGTVHCVGGSFVNNDGLTYNNYSTVVTDDSLGITPIRINTVISSRFYRIISLAKNLMYTEYFKYVSYNGADFIAVGRIMYKVGDTE